MSVCAREPTCSAEGLCRCLRVWTQVSTCAPGRVFSPRVRENAHKVGTRMYRCPGCVQGFASCVPEDASQIRRDTCGYSPRPRVSTCACRRPRAVGVQLPELSARRAEEEVTHPAPKARPGSPNSSLPPSSRSLTAKLHCAWQ